MRRTTRHVFCGILVLVSVTAVSAQIAPDTIGGMVTYRTSEHIYVRFASTEGIAAGDTLFVFPGGRAEPLLVVTQTSSTSCVGKLVSGRSAEVGMRMYARRPAPPAPAIPETPLPESPPVVLVPDSDPEDPDDEPVTVSPSVKSPPLIRRTRGRLSAASYVNVSDQTSANRQRMRYTFSMHSGNPEARGITVETYVTFRHTLGEWQDVQHDFKRAFKVYNLSVQYNPNERTRFWLGRKINLNMANLGAIDGLQAERLGKKFLAGAFAGTRPDHFDYGFNARLLQYGAYAGHRLQGDRGQMASTLAIAEQRNGGAVDRRFVYVQHTNALIRDIHLFASAEFDLFGMRDQQQQSRLQFTSAYMSVRYRMSDKLSVFASFDSRRNIIYYETYKSFLDQLIEDETRQGMRLSATLRPFRRVTLGTSVGYRFQRDQPRPTRNLNGYLTFARVPALKLSASLSALLLETTYMTGTVYGVRLYRDVFKGKLYVEGQYRRAAYRYGGGETTIQQQIGGLNLSWRIRKKLSFAVNYEGEFQRQRTLHRIYGNLVQRL